MTNAARVTCVILALAATVGCSSPVVDEIPEPGVTLLAVADIASCDSDGDEATAAIADTIPGTIIVAGDLAYETGSADDFARCYDPSWGRHRARTRPAPGNHEYNTPGATPFYSYFGAAAGEPGRGYYSFTYGSWHIVALNSNIDVSETSEQIAWLRMALTSNPSPCTLAFWHHPLFSSGFHGNNSHMQAAWRTLEEAGADVIVAGHDHHFERFTPQTHAGTRDSNQGIRQFIVGTGGRSLYPILQRQANSEIRNSQHYGLLRLTLGSRNYSWKFVAVNGAPVDSGVSACH